MPGSAPSTVKSIVAREELGLAVRFGEEPLRLTLPRRGVSFAGTWWTASDLGAPMHDQIRLYLGE